jgi:hypothetical protein
MVSSGIPPSVGAFGGNSSASTAMVNAEHDGGQQPSSAVAAAGGHGIADSDYNADRDYIMMDVCSKTWLMIAAMGAVMGIVSWLL